MHVSGAKIQERKRSIALIVISVPLEVLETWSPLCIAIRERGIKRERERDNKRIMFSKYALGTIAIIMKQN